VVLSRALRLNLITMFLTTNLNNPIFAPLLVYAELQVGGLLRNGAFYHHTLATVRQLRLLDFAADLIVGSIVVGLAAGLTLHAWADYPPTEGRFYYAVAPLWDGIEGADSIVFNPHKWLGAAFDCSLYYVRDPQHLIRVMSTNPSYLRSSVDNEVKNLRDWGIPLGRRFRALKLWCLIRSEGVEGLRARLRRDMGNARWLEGQVRQAAGLAHGLGGAERPLLEASGGITLQNVRQYAEAGADRISIGALTHSAPAADLALDAVP
jgi:hypothetical protein